MDLMKFVENWLKQNRRVVCVCVCVVFVFLIGTIDGGYTCEPHHYNYKNAF